MAIEHIPQWTARMYPGKVGRDHLGLGSVSIDRILPLLSPGINVLTFHPRYHSFYAFLLDEFMQSDLPSTGAAWKAFFRPREYIFSVGGHLPEHVEAIEAHGNLGHIVGGRATEGHARSEREFFEPKTHYIDSPYGGYGLYYRTVMAELGLIYPGGPGLPYPVDIPSEKGREVAAAFREVVSETAYYRDYFDSNDKPVPREVIIEYVNKACLCLLNQDGAPDRAIIRDVFLYGGAADASEARRNTFRMLLDLVDQTDGIALTQDAFRQLIYFQTAANGASYRPRDTVLATFRRWRLYQAREYYAFALNALWYYLCDWGPSQSGDYRPLPLSYIWTHLDDALDFESLARHAGLPSPELTATSSFTELIAWLRTLLGSPTPSFDAPYALDVPIHEHLLVQWTHEHQRQPWAMVAGMVCLMALMHLRFGEPDMWQESAWDVSRQGANGRLSVDRYLRRLRRLLAGGDVKIREVAQWLYRDYIILQHQAIASHKLPDNTFRFQREGNHLRFYHLRNNLRFMDSRFEALTTTLHGLGFCADVSEMNHPLTVDGQTLLDKGDIV